MPATSIYNDAQPWESKKTARYGRTTSGNQIALLESGIQLDSACRNNDEAARMEKEKEVWRDIGRDRQ